MKNCNFWKLCEDVLCSCTMIGRWIGVQLAFKESGFTKAHHWTLSWQDLSPPASQPTFLKAVWSPLCSRCNVIDSYIEGSGLIPGRVNFLVEGFFPGFFPQLQDKCQEIWVTFVPGCHLVFIIIQKPYSSVQGRWRSLTLDVVHDRL